MQWENKVEARRVKGEVFVLWEVNLDWSGSVGNVAPPVDSLFRSVDRRGCLEDERPPSSHRSSATFSSRECNA